MPMERAGAAPVTGTPAALRLRLLRDLDEALSVAYCGWPGEPPRWLIDLSAVVEIRLHQAEARLARSGVATKAAPAGAPSRGVLRVGTAEEVGPLAQQLGRARVNHVDHPPASAGAEHAGHPVEVIGHLAAGHQPAPEKLAGDDLEDDLLRRELGADVIRHGVPSADGLDGPSLGTTGARVSRRLPPAGARP